MTPAGDGIERAPEAPLTLRVNGEEHTLAVRGHDTLLTVIRERLLLTGTKAGCTNGDCGLCTVLVDGEAMYACLMFAARCGGRDITTIEGLARGAVLHPLQEAWIQAGATQCGICTPGMILTAKAFLERVPRPSEVQVREAISGTLCRCTGYMKIIEAILLAANSGAPQPAPAAASGH
ncbi:MAG: (2Fe-2S)-binding protein [Candidatus Tectomicrobia bacterium]|nr:(2Fe-2S)-binding protein [Candidatus Tectomicrobia bacterium]